jgi:hypothetical protein
MNKVVFGSFAIISIFIGWIFSTKKTKDPRANAIKSEYHRPPCGGMTSDIWAEIKKAKQNTVHRFYWAKEDVNYEITVRSR